LTFIKIYPKIKKIYATVHLGPYNHPVTEMPYIKFKKKSHRTKKYM